MILIQLHTRLWDSLPQDKFLSFDFGNSKRLRPPYNTAFNTTDRRIVRNTADLYFVDQLLKTKRLRVAW